MSLPAFLLLTDTAENRTLCRARALGKRVSVFSPRARTPAGGRSRCGFAKQIRGFSAQSPSSEQMRCLSNLSRPCPAPTEPQTRGESNSAQGAGVKQTLRQRRVGRAFPMAAQAETASRNPHSEWDAFYGWAVGGKLIPESRLKLGRAFRSIFSTPKPMRPPFQNWVEESQNAIAGGQYDCRR